MPIAAVVFDLDGTLVDSRPDLAFAIGLLREELGLQRLSEESVGGMIGEGARRLVERALGDAPPEISREGALSRFLDLYAGVCTRTTQPYAGIESLLRLTAARRPLAILTNKPIAMTERLLAHLGWRERFAVVLGGDSLPARKPSPLGLEAIAERLGTSRDRLVLVGDSRIDAETAAAGGGRFAWVTWGYAAAADRPALAKGLAFDAPDELAAWLAASTQ